MVRFVSHRYSTSSTPGMARSAPATSGCDRIALRAAEFRSPPVPLALQQKRHLAVAACRSSRVLILSSGLSSPTTTRRPFCARAAAAAKGSTVTMRARTSSPSTAAERVDQHRRALLQKVAILRQPLLEEDRLDIGRSGPRAARCPSCEPDLVRRSARSRTTAASRPGGRAALDRARRTRSSADTRSLAQQAGVSVERMAREEEADRFIFALQPSRPLARAASCGTRKVRRPPLRRTARSGRPCGPRRAGWPRRASARSRRRPARDWARVRRRRRRPRDFRACAC